MRTTTPNPKAYIRVFVLIMNPKYRPIDKKAPDNKEEEENPQDKYERIRSTILKKIEALIWVIVSVMVFVKTKFLHHLLHNDKANQIFLKIYLLSGGACFSILFFVTVVLPYRGYNRFEDYSENILIINNFFMIIAFLSCITAIFPIFSFWSLLMVPLFCMGFMMTAHFIPFKGNTNTLVQYLVFIAIFIYGYLGA